MAPSHPLLPSAVAAHHELFRSIRSAVAGVIQGKADAIELLLLAVMAGGHVLVEDVPGVGKTTLAKAIARVFQVGFSRVQFTPDLLPTDILGSLVLDPREGSFSFHRGPIFTNVLLADEINRASPRTQSALLEAMNEGQVSVDGTTTPLPDPFFVIATQNPQDFAGTYPLPESQLDRFMVRIKIGYPPPQVEMRLLLHGGDADRARHVPRVIDPAQLVALQREVDRVEFDASLATYLQAVLAATRSSPTLSLGASPRAGMNLARAARGRAVLHGRTYCIADDIHDLAVSVLAHRVRLAAHAEGYMPSRDECEAAVRDLVARVPVPL